MGFGQQQILRVEILHRICKVSRCTSATGIGFLTCTSIDFQVSRKMASFCIFASYNLDHLHLRGIFVPSLHIVYQSTQPYSRVVTQMFTTNGLKEVRMIGPVTGD